MEPGLLQKLSDYRVPEHAIELIKSSQVVFLVGVTAAGKDTVLKRLIVKPDYHHIVSHTTRPLRANHGVMEQNGVDYHFIDLATAETMLNTDGYIEAKKVHGNIYGTSVAEIQMAHDEGKIAISDIEVQGIAEYKAVASNVIPIFLLPPDYKTWQERLQKRSGGSLEPGELRVRLETAKDELQEALDKDYFEFVINRDLETTIKVVDEISHGNFSPEKNDQAKTVARQLLNDLALLTSEC